MWQSWYILFLFSMSTLISGCAWICFAPIFDLLQATYGVRLLTINYLSMSYCLLFLPMNFPSTYILDRFGLRVGITLGIAITVVGLWLRCLINKSFLFVVVGQTLLGIGQPFMYNAPAKVTGNWFLNKQRTISTMIGTTANLLGNLLGFFLPGIFIRPKYDRFQTYSEDQFGIFRVQIYNLMLALSIFGSVVLLLVLITFREKPSKPLPGSIILIQQSSNSLSFLDQLKSLKSRSYWLAAVSSSLTMSLYCTFSTVVGQLVHVHHQSDVEFLGFLLNFFGIVGSIVVSIVMTRLGVQYLKSNKIVAFLSFLVICIFWLTIESKNWTMASTSFLGFFNLPIFFVAYELAV